MIKYIRSHSLAQYILWTLLFVSIWELSSVLGWTNQYLLPSFSRVIQELTVQVSNGVFLEQIGNSFVMILCGFSVSILAASVLIVLCNYSAVVDSLARTICVIFSPLPGVAIMPLIIMFFGINESSMIVLMVHSVLWPLVINILGGIKTIPAVYTEFGHNLELPHIKMVGTIHIFSIMPCIISGLRVGWGRAWRALISAEMVFGMIGELGGIGYFIYTNRAYGNMPRVIVGVLAVIIMGIFMESFVFGTVEKLTIRKWRM